MTDLEGKPLGHVFVGVLFMILFVAPETAFAYIDPGTGSVILQVLLGVIAALAVTMRLFWRKILVFFGIGKRTAQAPPTTGASESKDTTEP